MKNINKTRLSISLLIFGLLLSLLVKGVGILIVHIENGEIEKESPEVNFQNETSSKQILHTKTLE